MGGPHLNILFRPRYKLICAGTRSDDEGMLDACLGGATQYLAQISYIPSGSAGLVVRRRSASEPTHMGIVSSARLAGQIKPEGTRTRKGY